MSKYKEVDRLRQENIRNHIQEEKERLFIERVQNLNHALEERVRDGALTEREKKAIYAEGMMQIRLELGLPEDSVLQQRNVQIVADTSKIIERRAEAMPPKILQEADFIKPGTL